MSCVAHRLHAPVNMTVEAHHVVPQAWQYAWQPALMGFPGRGDHGMLWDARTVELCPTGHRNVHALIVALMHGRPVPRRRELAIARLALTRFQEAGGDLQLLRDRRLWGEA